MKHSSFSVNLLGLLIVFNYSSCSRRSSPPEPSPTASSEHILVGEVLDISGDQTTITVRHDDIPGFMPAMTMDFLVLPEDSARLEKGQHIQARLSQDGNSDLRLDRIQVTGSPEKGRRP